MDKYYKFVKASEELPTTEGLYFIKHRGQSVYFTPSNEDDIIRFKEGGYEWLKEVEPLEAITVEVTGIVRKPEPLNVEELQRKIKWQTEKIAGNIHHIDSLEETNRILGERIEELENLLKPLTNER